MHHHPSFHGARVLCCPLHAMVGFAPGRHRHVMLSADAPPVSFSDSTPKTPSARCTSDRSATAGLFEAVPEGRDILFRDARVLTMRGNEVLLRHDVLVRDGVIAGIAPTGGVVPESAVVIEAAGKTLMPGLTEIHAHIFTAGWAQAFAPMVQDGGDGTDWLLPYDLILFQLLANGITRVEIMAGCPDTVWMRDSVRNGTLIGPRFSVGSPMIDGAPAMHSPIMSYVVGDRAGGERAGDTLGDMGFDFAKPYSRLPADGYEGLMAACDRRGIRVMGHVPIAVGIEAAVARGQSGIAHAAELFYNETGPERTDEARMARLARIMADAGTWLQATMVVTRRMEGRFTKIDLNAPDIAYMNPLQRALWAPDSPMMLAMQANKATEQYFDRTFELTKIAIRLAYEVGVPILTGTDFPNPYVIEGFSLHEELKLLVEDACMRHTDVLSASTRQAAVYHGGGAADGMVAEGGIADLILIDGDPLTDIDATRLIDTVLVDGRTLLRRAAITDGLSRIRAVHEAMPRPTVVVPASSEYVGQA